MGRGRAKAKQTKVARRLKYYSPETDLSALERELTSHGGETAEPASDDDLDDRYDGPEDDDDVWASGHR